MHTPDKFLIVIAGPTAVGKSAAAIALARHFSCAVLSADSRQFYKEMSIGTAKPSLAERQGIPHYFIDSLSISEAYTAADFERDALQVLQKLFTNNQVAVMCGGSGLFIKAVCEGLDPLPARNEALREKLESLSTEALQQRLLALDPEYYHQVDLQNRNRLIRAIEVCEETGDKYSQLRKKTEKIRDFIPIKIMLDLPREELYARINKRVDEMLAAGLEAEAKALYPHRQLGSLQTVGYTEWFDCFDGLYSRAEAIDKIKQHSRNYAKRQLTWFRKESNMHSLQANQVPALIRYVEEQIAIFQTKPPYSQAEN